MLAVAATEVRSRRDPGDAHLSHVPLDRLAVDRHTIALQLRGDPPRTVEGMLRVKRVDPVLEGHFFE